MDIQKLNSDHREKKKKKIRHGRTSKNERKWCHLAWDAGTYPRTMMSLVNSCDTQGLQSQRTRYAAQSFWRNRKVAAMRSRSFILRGPYWTADDSSVVKNSLWNTGGLWLKYLAANLYWIKWILFNFGCGAANNITIMRCPFLSEEGLPPLMGENIFLHKESEWSFSLMLPCEKSIIFSL